MPDTEPPDVDASRDALGRRVREVWIAWAQEQPSPKPSRLVSYDDLSEPNKEADRRIGVALWGDGFAVVEAELAEARGRADFLAAALKQIADAGCCDPASCGLDDYRCDPCYARDALLGDGSDG